jgi:branched-subunit amino acid aminotransferase/4-amino-4-deoxychorismate lyase
MRRQRFVFLNHRLLVAEDAHLSVDDAGFLLGDGVFETCGLWNGVPFLLDDHLERLRAGLRFTEIREPDALGDLRHILDQLVQANGLQDTSARARITVSRGSGDEPTFLVTAAAWSPPAGLEDGVTVDFARDPVLVSPWRQVKSTSRQPSVLAGRRRTADVYDSLLWNLDGVLTEGTYSNLFGVEDSGRLVTPRIEDGCLAGVTRAAVLQVARGQGVAVWEGPVRPADLAPMREIFLTSSMGGVVPVRRGLIPAVPPDEWQASPPGSTLEWASPGPVTLRIRTAYREWLKESTCRAT